MPRHCLFCANPVTETQRDPPYYARFDCAVCGPYYLSERAASQKPWLLMQSQSEHPAPVENHYLISATIRERFEQAGEVVFIPDLTSFLAALIPAPDAFQAADRVVSHVARKVPLIGGLWQFEATTDYPIAVSKNPEEFTNLLYLGQKMGYWEIVGSSALKLTPPGLRRLRKLRTRPVDPNSAFVAIGFGPQMIEAYELGIKPALQDTGYLAIRVDQIEHNEKVDDRIIAEIRRSSLLVADFTGHRQNVYFEAGLATGIGLHVIWLCHERDISEAHFDTRQYNHIVWSAPPDLRAKLRNRIEATIPGRAVKHQHASAPATTHP